MKTISLKEGKSKYAHRFGGSWNEPFIPNDAVLPIHLVYTIDMSDPLVPIQFPIEKLPLFYCFYYNGASMAYQLDGTIPKLIYIDDYGSDVNFPYNDYPTEFPSYEVTLSEISNENKKLIDELILERSKQEQNIDLVLNIEKALKQYEYPFTQIGGNYFLLQGIPNNGCLNPICKYNELKIILVSWSQPVAGLHLWENKPKYQYDFDTQIIFQLCEKCHTIHVCNRCT